jgi:hypothetical protein
MSMANDLTQTKLKELFKYDATGTFVRRSNGKIIAPNLSKGQRYPRISVNGKPRSLHRIVFCWHHGYYPEVIDHINNDRLDNRIENLRETTQANNCLNRKHNKNSKSPYKNVYGNTYGTISGPIELWVVNVTINGKRTYFGSYDDIEFANLVAIEVRDKYHGAFVNHGGI